MPRRADSSYVADSTGAKRSGSHRLAGWGERSASGTTPSTLTRCTTSASTAGRTSLLLLDLGCGLGGLGDGGVARLLAGHSRLRSDLRLAISRAPRRALGAEALLRVRPVVVALTRHVVDPRAGIAL